MNKIAYNEQDLINQYNYLNSGHFFDRDTMRFFKSRVTCNYKRISDTVAYFITTEKGPLSDSKRLATIRRAELKSYIRESDKRQCFKIEIDTVGEFNSMTMYRAKKVLEGIK